MEETKKWYQKCFIPCPYNHNNPILCDCYRCIRNLCPVKEDKELMIQINNIETSEIVTNLLNNF